MAPRGFLKTRWLQKELHMPGGNSYGANLGWPKAQGEKTPNGKHQGPPGDTEDRSWGVSTSEGTHARKARLPQLWLADLMLQQVQGVDLLRQ